MLQWRVGYWHQLLIEFSKHFISSNLKKCIDHLKSIETSQLVPSYAILETKNGVLRNQ